jgi:integrase
MDWKGNIKDEINLKQKKTSNSHLVMLSQQTKESLKAWIKKSKKFEDDFLFSGNTKFGKQRKEKLSRTTYSRFIKEWAEYLHLDPRDYASHSLRRTRAAFMYKQGVGIEIIRRLLGQKSIESTRAYLGIEQEEAFEIGKKFMI